MSIKALPRLRIVTLDKAPIYLPYQGRFVKVVRKVPGYETTADLSKVYVTLLPDNITISLQDIDGAFIVYRQLVLTWESSENGKLLIILFAEQGLIQQVYTTIAKDLVGIAKDVTMKDKLPRYIVDSQGNELSDYFKSIWKPDLKLYDETVPSGEVWNLSGNMIRSVNNLTVQGTIIVSDEALLRTWGNVLVDGGKVIIQDSGKVLSEVVSS